MSWVVAQREHVSTLSTKGAKIRMEKVKLEQKEDILSLSAILWLPLCYSHSADALASVDESEVRGDKDFSGLWSPKGRRCHSRGFWPG